MPDGPPAAPRLALLKFFNNLSCSNSTSDVGWKPVNSGANGPRGACGRRWGSRNNWVAVKGLSSCGQFAHLNQVVCAFCSMFDGVGWNSSATLPQCLHRSHYCAVTAEQQKVLPLTITEELEPLQNFALRHQIRAFWAIRRTTSMLWTSVLKGHRPRIVRLCCVPEIHPTAPEGAPRLRFGHGELRLLTRPPLWAPFRRCP